MDLWDLIELALAVIGFLVVAAKVGECTNLNGLSNTIKQALGLVLSVALALAWALGTVAACRRFGGVGGVAASLAIIGVIIAGLSLAGKAIRAKREANRGASS